MVVINNNKLIKYDESFSKKCDKNLFLRYNYTMYASELKA